MLEERIMEEVAELALEARTVTEDLVATVWSPALPPRISLQPAAVPNMLEVVEDIGL